MNHFRPLGLSLALSASAAFAGPVTDLLPDLASTNVAQQETGQISLATLAAQASRPGADAERKAVAQEIAGLLTPALPSAAAFPLLRHAGLIGGDETVAAVAGLLQHAEAPVRDAARQALELIPAPAADAALQAGLAATRDEREQAGFVSSLGRRGTAGASAALIPLLGSESEPVRHAVLTALSHIADAPAIAALKKARTQVPAERRAAVTTALLDAAWAAAGRDQTPAAVDLFQFVGNSPDDEIARTQALLGLLLVDAREAPTRIEKALKSGSEVNQSAALTAVQHLQSPALARALVPYLAGLADPLKVQALATLSAVGDRSVAPAIAPLIQSTNESVARAAIRALGALGGGTEISALLQVGADAKWKKEVAAALEEARGPGVDDQLLKQLMSGPAESRALALDALVTRQSPGLQQQLMKLAGEPDDKLALPALAALKRVAGPADFDPLLAIARTATSRARMESTLAILLSVAGSASDRENRFAAIGKQVAAGSADAKRALLSAGTKYGQSAPLPAAVATLRLMAPLVDDRDVGPAAAHYSTELASRLLAADPDAVAQITARVLALSSAPADVKAKARALTGLEDGWLLSGLIAGPYEGGEIFTKAFPPESDAAGVAWAILSPEDRAKTNDKVIDLAKKIPGDNRVGYLKFAFQCRPRAKHVLSSAVMMAWRCG
jgi:HEAT repeat protein